jgi:glutathione S-transferase
MSLNYAGIQYEHREVVKTDLPEIVLRYDADGNIPLLFLSDTEVLNDSLEIMHWALLENDPDGWMDYEVDELDEMRGLIRINDNSFAKDVINYVHWDDSCDLSREQYRKDCELFLGGLEEHLQNSQFLFGDRVSHADFAIMPFVYLFSLVEMEWFRKALYPNVWKWLEYHTRSKLFQTAMKEHPRWRPETEAVSN